MAAKKILHFGSFAGLLNDLSLTMACVGTWFPNLGVYVLCIASSYGDLFDCFSSVNGSVFLRHAISRLINYFFFSYSETKLAYCVS